ncbi:MULTISPECIES: RidA family protein [Acutalibacteraceae]|uniref:RidA family protein n=1 Tax=Acutalibacteraceae TaxID=3082771 RepID=UPI00196B655E|nr:MULTISPECIES: RidA family protein [Acutalibacteraceae]
MNQTVYTKKAPEAVGPYSQAIVAGNLVFSSGQIPIDPATGAVVEGGISVQAEQSCKNVGEVLKAAGADFEDVVKTTCFLKDMNDFAAFNAVYAKYFTGKPARSCVAVRELPKGALVEVEAIAAL